jgi:hypothetical protein
MKISPYIIYLEMQPNALLLRQNFIIHKKWVSHRGGAPRPFIVAEEGHVGAGEGETTGGNCLNPIDDGTA